MTDNERTVLAMRPGVSKGTRLNGIYEIDRLIATGGMGEVYRGHAIETGDTVAIKMIRPDFAQNDAALALFRKEAAALHNLNHEAIVRYYVFSIDPALGSPYLAMEFVDGQSLSDRIRHGPLSVEEANILRKRIASGLDAAHELGIIHRDISPDNIILPGGQIGRAKIIDFGIARSTRLGEGTVIGGGFAGKHNYVSPEQLGLCGGEVTGKSDIYSLGLVLAEALSGRPLDMGGTQMDIVEKRRRIPDLANVDKRLRPLLARMLEPRPADRPASMADVASWEAPAIVPARRFPMIAIASLAGLIVLGGAAYVLVPNFGSRSGPVAPANPLDLRPADPPQTASRTQPPPLIEQAPPAAPTPGPAQDGKGAVETPPAARQPPEQVARPTPLTERPAPPPDTARPAAAPLLNDAVPAPEPRPQQPRVQEPRVQEPRVQEPRVQEPRVQEPRVSDSRPSDIGLPDIKPPETRPPETRTQQSPAVSTQRPTQDTRPAAPIAPDPRPTTPVPPTQPTVSQRPADIAVVTPPAPSLTPVQRLIRFVSDYDGGACFYLTPIEIAERKASIEGFGPSSAPFAAFDEAFQNKNGFEAQISVRQVTQPQCALVNFLTQVRGQQDRAPRLQINSFSVRSGDTLSGSIDGFGDRHVALLLVADDGLVYDLGGYLNRDGDRRTFELKVQLTGGPGSKPAIVLVVTSLRPLDALAGGRPVPADELFPRLLGDLQRSGEPVGLALKYFRIEG